MTANNEIGADCQGPCCRCGCEALNFGIKKEEQAIKCYNPNRLLEWFWSILSEGRYSVFHLNEFDAMTSQCFGRDKKLLVSEERFALVCIVRKDAPG